VKDLKNSQQMNYATPIERETLQVLFKESPCAELPWFAARSSSITAAVALVIRDMPTHLWDEMDYRIDVCRITKGGHIERL
jgi:hypothetical protein